MTDPDRAERAFRDAFASRAEALDPAVLDVRRRRRRVGPLLAAAAVLVVIAGSAVALSLTGSDAGTGSYVAVPAQSTGAASGWRSVAQGDVEVDVPDTWGEAYEPFDTCNYQVPDHPYVAQDPFDFLNGLVGCLLDRPEDEPKEFDFGDLPEDRWQPHVRFQKPDGPDATTTHDGWTVTTRTVGDTQLELLTDRSTDALASRILASARVVKVDADGCDTTSPIQAVEFVRPSPAFAVGAIDSVDSISLCLYTRTGTDEPGLTGSRRISGHAAQRLLHAIQAAPVGGGPEMPQNCTHDEYGDIGTVVRLNSGDVSHDVYAYTDWCFGNGFDDGTHRRTLTKAACSPIFAEPPVQMSSGDGTAFSLCSE